MDLLKPYVVVDVKWYQSLCEKISEGLNDNDIVKMIKDSKIPIDILENYAKIHFYGVDATSEIKRLKKTWPGCQSLCEKIGEGLNDADIAHMFKDSNVPIDILEDYANIHFCGVGVPSEIKRLKMKGLLPYAVNLDWYTLLCKKIAEINDDNDIANMIKDSKIPIDNIEEFANIPLFNKFAFGFWGVVDVASEIRRLKMKGLLPYTVDLSWYKSLCKKIGEGHNDSDIATMIKKKKIPIDKIEEFANIPSINILAVTSYGAEVPSKINSLKKDRLIP